MWLQRWLGSVLAAAEPAPAALGPQGQAQVVQAGGNLGMVGAVGGFSDGQGAFLQRPSLFRLP